MWMQGKKKKVISHNWGGLPFEYVIFFIKKKRVEQND